MTDLRCTECGAIAEPKCSCKKTHDYIPAREAAKLAIAAHPDWSDRRIAEAVGCDHTTIGDARRKAGGGNPPPEKRIGRNGRTQVGRKRRQSAPDELRQQAAKYHIDDGLSLEDAISKAGLDCSVQVLKTAVAEELGRRKERNDPQIDPTTLSKSAQERLASAIRHHQRELDAQFEFRVQSDIQRRVKELVMPAFGEEKADAALVIKSRKGIFTQVEYNAILRCLHPDLNPTVDQKNEAFRLWHARKLVLMSEKDDPRQYPSLPTVDEFMARFKKSA